MSLFFQPDLAGQPGSAGVGSYGRHQRHQMVVILERTRTRSDIRGRQNRHHR